MTDFFVFNFFKDVFLFKVYACFDCMHGLCVVSVDCPQTPEEAIGSSRTGLTDDCEVLGTEPRTSGEQPAPFNAEP